VHEGELKSEGNFLRSEVSGPHGGEHEGDSLLEYGAL
jgi:hypothetical protein